MNKILKKLVKDYGNQCNQYHLGECLVLVSIDAGRYHLSISHQTRQPTYDEVKEARYKFLPDNVHMAMIFPPKSEFVNIHNFCFHLWQI